MVVGTGVGTPWEVVTAGTQAVPAGPEHGRLRSGLKAAVAKGRAMTSDLLLGLLSPPRLLFPEATSPAHFPF